MALTALMLKQLKCEQGKRYTNHLDRDGLYLRVYADGVRSYVFRYKMLGKAYELTIGGTDTLSLSDARKEHARLRASVKKGVNIKLERDLKAKELEAIPTIRVFSETFIERYAKHKNKAWAEQQRIINADVLPMLGAFKINAIERRHITSLLDKKEETGAYVARNRLLSLLSKMFNYAIERGLISHNPAKGITKLKENNRTRILSDNEIKLFWDWLHNNNCHYSTNAALKLAILTGQRVSEICGINEFDINGDWWTIKDTKNGKPHSVYLTNTTKQIINELRPYSNKGYLILDIAGKQKDANTLANSMADAKIIWNSKPRPTPHDLRRTLISGISRLGFSRMVQDKVSNHVDSSVGGIYDQYSYEKEKRQALEAWERHLLTIVSRGTIDNIVAFKTA